MSVKIGNTVLKNGLLLAPMAGVSDSSFRKICISFGAEYTVSEMISSKAIHFKDKKTETLAAVKKEEMPVALQIFGSDPDIMAEAAQKLSTVKYGDCLPVAIDINMGCPVKKIVCGGDGSALARDPDLAARVIFAVKNATDLPVTVKFRSGWSASEITAPTIAKIAEENGASAVCIHGRTRAQMYAPPVDLDIIKEVKKCVSASIPVIGNGDIYSADDAERMFDYTGCDAVMIGRGALGNPWIFEEISARLEGKTYIRPDCDEILKTAEVHMKDLILQKGAKIGVMESRKHIAWYTKGMDGAAEMRAKINTAQSEDELFTLLSKYRTKLKMKT